MVHTVMIQLIETFEIQVEADSEEKAVEKVLGMQSLDIKEQGNSVSIESDYAEIV